MIELELLPHSEALADPTVPDYPRLVKALNDPASAGPAREPLYHQWRTNDALRQAEIVTNSYNTGTGKTVAALLHLLDLDAAFKAGAHPHRANVLLIAPTNELLRQHAADVQEFITGNALAYDVLPLDAPTIRRWGKDYLADASIRSSRQLEMMLRNPLSVLPNAPEGRRPYVLVTNPDIFYYALYGLYNQHERRALFNEFVENFAYIIIDELHYYNAKQLANFLFLFTLLREWKYFSNEGRKVCLLTATPSPQVAGYLDRLAGTGLTIAHVAPGAEPDGLRRVAALAPVRLRLYAAEALNGGLIDLAHEARPIIEEWLANGRHGAFISSALWRINRLYSEYQGQEREPALHRLTGPQSSAIREGIRDQMPDLLFATPTVDIGYNFKRPGKTRQSIDFLLFDAYYADELIQRLGRAGRVLGQAETSVLSDVWAVVPDRALAALRDHAKQPLARRDLADHMREALSARHGIYSYIERGAIAEAFLPIYNLGQGSWDAAGMAQAEHLFAGVQAVYGSNQRFWGLQKDIKFYRQMQKQIHQLEQEAQAAQFTIGPASVQAGYLATEYEADRLPDASPELPDAVEYVTALRQRVATPRAQQKYQAQRLEEIEKYYVIAARFNFRDSYDPPQAVVHDPQQLLSSGEYTVYSAIHIAQNYEAEWSGDVARIRDWSQQIPGIWDDTIRLACQIIAPREPRLPLQLVLDAPGLTRLEWEERYTCRVVALAGLRWSPAPGYAGQVPARLNNLFARQYLPIFTVPEHGLTARALNALRRTTSLFTYDLEVNFSDLQPTRYLVVLGSAALLVADETTIRNACHAMQRNNQAAIIC